MSKTLKTTQLKNKTRSTAETTTAATTKRATGTTATTATTKRTTATTKASGATTKTSESTASKKTLGSTATIKATGTTKPSASTKPTATIKTTTGSNSTTSTPRSRTLSKAGSIDGASTKTTTAATGAATTTTIKAKPQTTAKRPTAGTTTKPTAETKTTSKTSNSLKTSNLLKTSNSVTSSKTSTSSKTPTSSKTATSSKTPTSSKTSTSSKTPTSSRTTATSRNVASSERSQPMRAQHSAAILEAVRKHATPTVGPIPGAPRSPARPNPVLDTYHNVTVVSPPPKRRELPPRDGETAEETNGRPRTRTLDTEEVVVLRSASAKRRSERLVNGVEVETVERETMSLETRSLNSKSLEPKSLEPNSLEPEKPKEPIAFEVTFDERQKSSRDRSRSRPREGQPKPDKVKDETAEYSDDFESYESDFETGSTASTNQNVSTTTSESEEGESEEGESEEGESEEASEDDSELDSESPPDGLKKGHETDEEDEDEEEESELTQFPVTVIQREKERKLDSGHYEMNSQKQQQQQQLQQQHQQQSTFDSLDTFSAGASEQLDSGISSYGNGIQNHDEVMNQGGGAGRKGSKSLEGSVVYGGYAAFNTRPVRTQRGLDLMSKIQFDTLSFTLLDLRPIAYDEFMRTFGKLNTTQSSTQTRDHRTATEAQTEACDVRSMWTQHPPQYDLQTVQRLTHGLGTVQNCCGELQPQDGDLNLLSESSRDDFDRSLQALGRFRAADDHRSVRQQLRRLRKPVDVERLNGFLLHASLLVSRVLASNSSGSHPTSTSSPECLPLANATPLATVSRGYRRLGTGLLDALRVVRIFANAKFNLVITVHESRPEADVYRSDFSNLLMVWSISDCSRPLRLLSTWSDVCRAEICNESADIVVCGLRDGSVAMWDLRETYSFCSKLDGHLTHFAATQSIVPSWGSSTSSSSSSSSSSSTKKLLLDLGAVVDVKSFRSPPKKVALGLAQAQSIGSYKTIQFASLNDTGILAVWTLVETTTSQHQTPRELSSSRRGAQASTSSLRSEFSSPWARVKLIQSAICDLREYLEHGMLTSSRLGQTKFDQTKALFQKNIYSDDVLRELNETQSELRQGQGAGSGGLKGLRFTSIDVGVERIYVCTNRNFILACSKSLKAERFRKITINESRFLFPTALRVLTNEFFLAVGLSNGSVMILNCDHSRSSLAEGASKGSSPSRREAERAPPPTTSYDTMSSDIDLVTGKSCAIQNIILNERRFNDRPSIDPGDHELRPSTTAACLAMIEEQKKPFELRVYDQQILLSGSGLRKHLVQSLELTNDGWKLFALSNGEVRVYDFYLDREVVQHGTMGEGGNETKVVDMTVTSSGPMEHQLLLLSGESEVQIHLLKQ